MSLPSFDRWFDTCRYLLDVKQGRVALSVPVVDFEGKSIGRLEPLTARHAADEETVDRFVRWRNQNLAGYLDQRPVTRESTRTWLEDVALSPTRLSFLIYSGERAVGKCGMLHIRPRDQESDGLMRGERGGGPMLIHFAQVACLIWSFRVLKNESVLSKVLSTNEPALTSCERLGYDRKPERIASVFLKEYPNGRVLEEQGSEAERVPELALLYLRLTRDRFLHAITSHAGFRQLDESLCRGTIGTE